MLATIVGLLVGILVYGTMIYIVVLLIKALTKYLLQEWVAELTENTITRCFKND